MRNLLELGEWSNSAGFYIAVARSSFNGASRDLFTSPSRLRVKRDTVWALTTSSVTIPTTRPLAASRCLAEKPLGSPQKLSCTSRTKCWNCSVIGVTFAIGCKPPFPEEFGLRLPAKPTYTLLLFTHTNLRHPFSWHVRASG